MFTRYCAAAVLGIGTVGHTAGATVPSKLPTTTEILSFTFLTPTLGWRATDRWNPDAGAQGPLVVSRTMDGGLHWQPVATVTGAISGEGQSFTISASSLLFADARDGWLYGNRLFATHDGGRTWQRLPMLGTQTSLSVAGRSVWRLDTSCRSTTAGCRYTLLASVAGRDIWRMPAWQPPRSGAIGWALARADPGHAWLVSGPYDVKNHSVLRMLATVDGGRSWHPQPMPCNRDPAVAMFGLLVPYKVTDLWLFCTSQPSAGSEAKSVFRSSNGGGSWRLVAASGGFGDESHGPRNLTVSGYLSNAAVTTRSDAWLALFRNTLVHTSDGGRTWRRALPYSAVNATGGGNVGPVQFVDARHGWLRSFPALLFRTADGGLHWRMTSSG